MKAQPFCPECWALRMQWAEVAIHMVEKHGLKVVPPDWRHQMDSPKYITCFCGKTYRGTYEFGTHLECLNNSGNLRNHTFVIEELKRL